MRLPDVCNPTTATLKNNVDETLEKYDSFIGVLARKNFPRSTTSTEVVDLDIDELAQTTRINLWLAMQKQEIRNMPAFIGRIVHNEAINIMRRYKPVASLVTNEEGEPYRAQVMIAGGQETQDPTKEIEYEEMLRCYSSKLTEYVPKLPPQQQRAMICALKDQIADILPLGDLFLPFGIDVETMHWSETASELQSERSSLSVARKKLRAYRREEMDC
jgi:DNA-directed RNA polymerase specialized sigma24 family protein